MSKRKVLALLAGILAVPIVSSASVSAVDSTCTITNTGPGSNNTCTVSGTYRCEVVNNNVVIYDSNNQQVATSGAADGSGNTSGGNATSGSATNSNGTTFNYTVTNGTSGQPTTCAVATVTTPEPEKPVGGLGAAGGAGEAVAAATPKPTVLAKTSGESSLPVLAGVVAAFAAIAASSRGLAVLRNKA